MAVFPTVDRYNFEMKNCSVIILIEFHNLSSRIRDSQWKETPIKDDGTKFSTSGSLQKQKEKQLQQQQEWEEQLRLQKQREFEEKQRLQRQKEVEEQKRMAELQREWEKQQRQHQQRDQEEQQRLQERLERDRQSISSTGTVTMRRQRSILTSFSVSSFFCFKAFKTICTRRVLISYLLAELITSIF